MRAKVGGMQARQNWSAERAVGIISAGRVGAALGDVEIIQDVGGIRSRWRQAVGLVTRP